MTHKPLIVADSGPLKYALSIPRAPEPGVPAPLLCFLHGYDEGGPRPVEEALTVHGPLSPEAAGVALDRFLVLAPQLPAKGDIWQRYGGMVANLARQVESSYRSDPARRYLTGFSFGANGVFDLALEQPGAWAALWAVDPTRAPAADPGIPVWLSCGQLARRVREELTRTLALGGREDRVFQDDGKDHVGTARAAYADEGIYRWLLARRL